MHRKIAFLRAMAGSYSLVLGLILVMCCIDRAIAMNLAATVAIDAQVKPRVAISAPDDALSWNISPKSLGIYTKTQIIHVKANADWQIAVRDSDSDCKGYMREWIGDGYGAKRLSKPMKISADKEIALPNGQPIVDGKMTGNIGVDVHVTFSQEVTADDLPLPDGVVYRKVIAFVGSPKT